MAEINRYSKYEPLFGAWYIRKKIGQGAIGQVYEIEREELGTSYHAALKAITIPEGPEDIKRVLSSGVAREDLPDYYRNLIGIIANEFKYLARLKGNSYIVNYEDHQIIEDEEEMKWDVLIKTELLMPLIEYVDANPLRERDVLQLGMDICRALKFCAQYNILHRDIKPENIFIAPSGNYKLGDFGIARVAEETYINLSRKGTYTYMAPEVFHGKNYDQTADLYSLGLVMYKYLNHGRIPFMPPYPEKISFDDTEKAFSVRMSGRSLPEPQTGSAKLQRTVLKACAFDPADRYESAEEMLAELEKIDVASRKKKRRSRNKSKGSAKTAEAGPYGRSKDLAGRYSAETAPEKKTIDRNTEEKVSESDNGAGSVKRKASKRIIAAVVFAFLLVLAAVVYYLIPKEVTDISGIESEILLYYDGKISPDYRVEPDWFEDEPIRFSSSNESIFDVTKDGVITAESIGEAELNMKAREYTETVHVSVVPKVTAISGVEKSYSLNTGDSIQLSPVLVPEEFKDETITYVTSDKGVAGVDASGLITAVSPGEAQIILSAGGSEYKTAVAVSDPVIYSAPASSKSSGSSSRSSGSKKKSSKKKSSGSSKGYFGDTEYF